MSLEKTKFTGTGVAIVTPFRKDESVDFKALANLVNFQIENKIDYIVALGTTGEPIVLSNDEKQAVVETIVETTNGRVPIVLGIGGNNTNDIVSKVKAVNSSKIDAILSVVPYYNKPSQNGIFEHYKAISNASQLPIIAYNVPGRTVVNMTAETTLKIANELKNIIGVKDASGNLLQLMDIIKNKPSDFKVISGDDGFTYPLMTLGGSGVISVVANIFPFEFSNMVNLCLQNKYNEALQIHYKLIDFINLLFAEGSPSGIKAALEIKGHISNYLRLPLTPVSDKLLDAIKLELNKK